MSCTQPYRLQLLGSPENLSKHCASLALWCGRVHSPCHKPTKRLLCTTLWQQCDHWRSHAPELNSTSELAVSFSNTAPQKCKRGKTTGINNTGTRQALSRPSQPSNQNTEVKIVPFKIHTGKMFCWFYVFKNHTSYRKHRFCKEVTLYSKGRNQRRCLNNAWGKGEF